MHIPNDWESRSTRFGRYDFDEFHVGAKQAATFLILVHALAMMFGASGLPNAEYLRLAMGIAWVHAAMIGAIYVVAEVVLVGWR